MFITSILLSRARIAFEFLSVVVTYINVVIRLYHNTSNGVVKSLMLDMAWIDSNVAEPFARKSSIKSFVTVICTKSTARS